MEEFAFLFCESCFVVEQVNNLSLSCGLFSELPDESDPFLQPFDVADAHVRGAPLVFFCGVLWSCSISLAVGGCRGYLPC
ncbi:hypothetical protein HTY54_28520 [Escherichia coli]|nr:hypothetical protein [Escherichia coli]